MAKLAGKGTILKQTISAVLTAVAQVVSMDTDGFASETYDGTCLDSGVGKVKNLTGYADGGTASFELMYDPSLVGHQAITDIVATPAECAWSITYTDAKITTFTSSGISIGSTVVMDDALKMSVSLTITGNPVFPT